MSVTTTPPAADGYYWARQIMWAPGCRPEGAPEFREWAIVRVRGGIIVDDDDCDHPLATFDQWGTAKLEPPCPNESGVNQW